MRIPPNTAPCKRCGTLAAKCGRYLRRLAAQFCCEDCEHEGVFKAAAS
jgi:hypothetical protein